MTPGRRLLVLLVAFGWLAPVPAPNPACLAPAPYHCDPAPK